MQLSIGGILSHDAIVQLRETLAKSLFVDGRKTAGWAAELVKNNEQAVVDATIEELTGDIAATLCDNPVFQIAVRPKTIIKTMFSRYKPGMSYGTHVDNALMGRERTDVSFTLFLSDPDTYDGGELIIETASGEDAVKLPAGSVFTYPSSTLHRVAPVTRGERLALVGWARSYIRDPSQRELLFDLDTARRTLFNREGASAEFDLISKSSANLLRMWIDD